MQEHRGERGSPCGGPSGPVRSREKYGRRGFSVELRKRLSSLGKRLFAWADPSHCEGRRRAQYSDFRGGGGDVPTRRRCLCLLSGRTGGLSATVRPSLSRPAAGPAVLPAQAAGGRLGGRGRGPGRRATVGRRPLPVRGSGRRAEGGGKTGKWPQKREGRQTGAPLPGKSLYFPSLSLPPMYIRSGWGMATVPSAWRLFSR